MGYILVGREVDGGIIPIAKVPVPLNNITMLCSAFIIECHRRLGTSRSSGPESCCWKLKNGHSTGGIMHTIVRIHHTERGKIGAGCCIGMCMGTRTGHLRGSISEIPGIGYDR